MFIGNTAVGLWLKDGAKVQMEDCQVRQGRQQGILVDPKGKLDMERCEVYAQHGAQIEVVGGECNLIDCKVSFAQANTKTPWGLQSGC